MLKLRMVTQVSLLTVLCTALTVTLAGCDESGASDSAGETTTAAGSGGSASATAASATNESPTRSAETSTAVTSGRRVPGQSTATPSDTGGARATTTIEFNKTIHDFGTIWDIEEQSYEFTFTNTGDSMLVIEDIKTSCGCTAAELEQREFAPGEGDSIGVSFKPKGHGEQTKNITITSNASNAPVQTLYIRSDIKQFVTPNPSRLLFGTVKQGERQSKSILLTSVDPNFEIIEIKPNRPEIEAELVGDTAGPAMPGESSGGPKEIRVTLTENVPWGQFFGAVQLTVRGRLNAQSPPVTHDMSVAVNAKVFGAVRVDPPFFRVAIVPPGKDFDAAVELISMNGKPFELTSVEIVNANPPTMNVAVEPINQGKKVGYRLLLTGESGDYMGTLRGNVRVETDIPGEDPIFVRVAGIVREPDKPRR